MSTDCDFCKKVRNKIKSIVPQSVQKTPLQVYEQLQQYKNPFQTKTKKQVFKSALKRAGLVRNDK